jgi:hypothetical protein
LVLAEVGPSDLTAEVLSDYLRSRRKSGANFLGRIAMGLAQFVDKLTRGLDTQHPADDPPGALVERRGFNRSPDLTLGKHGVAGEALLALMSMDETRISEYVVREFLGNAWTPAQAQAYSNWLQRFAGWTWPYGDTFNDPADCNFSEVPGVLTAAYTKPKCRVRDVQPRFVTQADMQSTGVTIKGEGFLKNPDVQFWQFDPQAPSKQQLAFEGRGVPLDSDSTFRCGRISGVKASLGPGSYRIRVLVLVGGGLSFPIDDLGMGVTFQVT